MAASHESRADRTVAREVVQRHEFAHDHALAAAAINVEKKGDAVKSARKPLLGMGDECGFRTRNPWIVSRRSVEIHSKVPSIRNS